MSSFSFYKNILQQQGSSIGQVRLHQSDIIMENTWDFDLQSKKCFIYDYYHDDQPWLSNGMTYENTTKTPIDAKFIINSYQTFDKDQVVYHIQFRPSQKLYFTHKDDLYYYETDYRNKYDAEFPIGMYCDIPDDKGIYKKWLIVGKEIANQFTKYLVLPCNYYFHWIDSVDGKKIIRKIWGITRSQNSYNSGLWTDYMTTSVENQFKAILPINTITEKLFYTNDEKQNQRLVISAHIPHPIVWQISKVETMTSGYFGLLRLTFSQDKWNPNIDFIDENAINHDGSKDLYAMYADYNDTNLLSDNNQTCCNILVSNNKIKIGGSYKTLSLVISDNYLDKFDYINSDFKWSAFIDGEDYTNSDFITWLAQPTNNKMKLKLNNDRRYLSKKLIISCVVSNKFESITASIELDIISL